MGKTFHWKSRYTVLAILFITSIISYVDRIAMSVAMPYIASDYHLSSMLSGLVLSVFFAGYSISQIPGGLLADIFGGRKVATVAMLIWSAFTAMTGAAGSLAQMVVVRFLFGLGEGVFPACTFKSVAVWFPKKERATANAIRLGSSPLGAALAPLAVVGIMSFWGWRTVFFSLFIPGVLMALLFWLFVPDKPSDSARVSPEEIAEIEEGGDGAAQHSAPKVKLMVILNQPYVLKYVLVLFAFDIAYWGFTTWLPTYLVKSRDFSMVQMGVAASLPFFAGTIGSVLAGWVSEKFFSNDRRLPLVATQLICVALLYLMFTTNSLPMLVLYQTLAGFFLNFFVSAFWALPMNTVPSNLMGVASGYINMGGQVAAFISPICIGYILGASGGNFDNAFMFLMATILVSLALIFTIPRNAQADPKKKLSKARLAVLKPPTDSSINCATTPSGEA